MTKMARRGHAELLNAPGAPPTALGQRQVLVERSVCVCVC